MKTINWSEPFTMDEVEALKQGEEFTLFCGGTPISVLSMDEKQNIHEVEL